MTSEQTITPWSSVGYLTYKRTYARRKDDNDPEGPTEEFENTVDRVILSARDQLHVGFTTEEEDRLRSYLLQLKGSVAGRFWWQMGTSTVDKLGLSSLQNCAFVVVDKPVRPFTWAMDMLMLGSGVGYNIQKKHIDKIPPVNLNFVPPVRKDTNDADFIVPDSREGWVKLLGKTLKAAFMAEQSPTFSYSTTLIRGKGALIKGFGGVASGPEDLVQGIERVSKILHRRRGKKIRPIDALDIMNIIGSVVVAGNVRRSAQIAIGDADDVEFLLAKRWDMGNIPPWRGMSNNSVVCSDVNDLHDFFWDGYEGKGEPYGLINLNLSRKVGRLGDIRYTDPNVQGYNPCVTGDMTVEVIRNRQIQTMTVNDVVDCFNAGEQMAIKSLHIGSDTVSYMPITNAWMTKHNAKILKITDSETGKFIKVTEDHLVFTKNRGYVEAKDLTQDDELVFS